jgi:hypothetical protein
MATTLVTMITLQQKPLEANQFGVSVIWAGRRV